MINLEITSSVKNKIFLNSLFITLHYFVLLCCRCNMKLNKVKNIGRFDLLLSARFESLGSWVARSPGTFILFPILITLLMGSGIQQFSYASDVFYLFVPVTARSIRDADQLRTLFPPDPSRYVQGSELGRQQMMEVVLVPRSPLTALSPELWEEARRVARVVDHFQGTCYPKLLC